MTPSGVTGERGPCIKSNGATTSNALATSGTQQVGAAVLNGEQVASLWSGTSNSWVNLNPTGSTLSEADGISGNIEVGNAEIGGFGYAGYWTGGDANSFTALPTLGNEGAIAYGISVVGGTRYIVGQDGAEAVLWTQAVPEPSAFLAFGLGELVLLRRRRAH